MSHSVVKVTDAIDNDSLLLLVGEDGTVTPDKETVKSFLNSKSGSTNIQLMHINKSDGKSIDVSIDNLTYVPDDNDVEEVVNQEKVMDQLAHNLYSFRLDHDYTPFTSPKRPEVPVDDELAQTLGILEGTIDSEPPELIMPTAPMKVTKVIKTMPKLTPTKLLPTPVTSVVKSLPPPTLTPITTFAITSQAPTSTLQSVASPEKSSASTPATTPVQTKTTPVKPVTPVAPVTPVLVSSTPKPRAKVIKTQKPSKPPVRQTKPKPKIVEEILEDIDDYEEEGDEDFELDYLDDENDSDFELEEVIKIKTPRRTSRRRTKSETSKLVKPRKSSPVKIKEPEPQKAEKPPTEATQPSEQKSQDTEQKPSTEQKTQDKKPQKKEKKPPKPIPDDFALFSTPDIIRRVGGKEPTTPGTPTQQAPTTPSLGNPEAHMLHKPGKITQENRSKSTSDSNLSPIKHNRLSVDSKVSSTEKEKHSTHHRSNSESKHKDRRISTDSKSKRTSIDENKLHRNPEKTQPEHRKSIEHATPKVSTPSSHHVTSSESNVSNLESISSDAMNDIMLQEQNKSFSSSIPMEVSSDMHSDQNNMNLEAAGLDLDQSILDNINNDLISEDILYQVAQSLVANTELQNAIDKSLNEGNLVLDPSIQQAMQEQNTAPHSTEHHTSPIVQKQTTTDIAQKGTQIVRPDGRIVVIPPIERPTTRSRNKKKDDEKPVFKPIHKPLDDEHVSGNELDSSDNEEEESEDDPNKLWCICNQPHNNRFMICCDTCEEWYHGKCVNITKTMGQQMEAEGKEWICLFCKDGSLRRPQAAARRVRKASRASRASSDSTGSSKKGSESGTGSVPCVVCQKPARKNSIFCSESCILAHAQGVEKVVVFERSTGTMLTGNKAPTAANLEQWLRDHPGYEVVRSTGKVVTHKAPQLTQSKLKIVKNTHNDGVSLAVQKKGVNVSVLKHAPKHQQQIQQAGKPQGKGHVTGFKIVSKHATVTPPKTVKLVQAQIQLPQKSTPPHISPGTPKVKSNKVTPKTTPVEKKTPKEKPATPAKDKPMPVKTPKARQAELATPQPKQQENIRENVQKTLLEQLTSRLKEADDLKLSEDELKNISNEIESQLFKCFGDTGQKYRNKYRSLIFNIKDPKNQTLWRRICEKAVNPYQLVRLSSDDLASQELALWREREAKHQLDMIKKSELELLNCNRQYVLKTHKGEQILEDSRPTDSIDNTEVITSLTEGSKPDTSDSKTELKEDKRSTSKHRHKDKERDKKSSRDKSTTREHRSHRSSSHDRDRSRRRSRSRDRSRHGKKKSRSRDRERDRHRRSSHKSSKHKRDLHSSNSSTDKLDKKSKEILEQLVDNKIVPPLEDRLWKHVPQDDIVPASIESDSDHEPSSTVTIPTPPRSSDPDDYSVGQPFDLKDKDKNEEEERSTSPPLRKHPEEIWRGTISMIDVAQICITAHEVSGDCSGLGTELPPNLDIVGRISPETVWDYIGKMKCSNSKIISLVRLNAINIEEKMPYLALYSYLSSRNRLGVVKSINKAVKDFYILPLASQKPIPQALLPISGPGFEESRPALLLGIIVRDKRKRPTVVEPAAVPATPVKRVRVETPPLPAQGVPTRSYTPPPSKDPRLKLPLPPVLPPVPPLPEEAAAKGDDDDDEPYSPEDSDQDSSTVAPNIPAIVPSVSSTTKYIASSSTPPQPPFPILAPKIDPIPGLDASGGLSSNTKVLETHLAEINKKIAESKSEINSISQNLASADIGQSALASIALPSNLQQILDSIKTIVPVAGESEVPALPPDSVPGPTEGNLTIPLLLPNKFSRPLSANQTVDLTSDTIPLKLPKGKKSSSVNSPQGSDPEKSGSVLSSLSEEELIRKAAEMLGEDAETLQKKETVSSATTNLLPTIIPGVMTAQTTVVKTLKPDTPPSTKRPKMDLSQPPIPELESELS